MSQSEKSMLAESPQLFSASRIDGICNLSDYNDDLTSLVYVKDGRGEVVIENVTYSIREGDIIICHPFVHFILSSSSEHPLQLIHYSFTLQVSGKNKGQLLDPGQCPVFPLRNQLSLMGNYFESILREYEQPITGSAELTNSLLRAVTIMLIRMIEGMKVAESTSMIQNVKAYIERYFARELTLSDLAELVFVSPYHLVHKFKSEVGMAPIQYLIYCRIKEAKNLLNSTDLSINEISSRVGYPNPNYFNQIFKKMVGVPPGKYRKDGTVKY